MIACDGLEQKDLYNFEAFLKQTSTTAVHDASILDRGSWQITTSLKEKKKSCYQLIEVYCS